MAYTLNSKILNHNIKNHNTKSLLLKQHSTSEHMKQPHSILNEMHKTKKFNHHRKNEWMNDCKTYSVDVV